MVHTWLAVGTLRQRGWSSAVERVHGELGSELRAITTRHGTVLLLKLATSLTLLALDAFALSQGQHLLVLDAKLATAEFHVVESVDDLVSLTRGGEVSKGQTSEDAIVEVVVEGIGQRQVHVNHELNKLLFLDSEGDVLDDNGSGDQLVIIFKRLSSTIGTSRRKKRGRALGTVERRPDLEMLV
jgi:hypothetical protein